MLNYILRSRCSNKQTISATAGISIFSMFSKRKAMDAGKRPAFHEGHAAPLIQILAWLFLVFSILAVTAQFATKKAMARQFVRADFVLLAALVSV